ncbi:MAG: winged helix-turn-helix domain-containing protein [Halobacteriales archaeon]
MSLSVAGGDGSGFDPERVFELLGNETRVEILQRLWEAYDPFAESNGLAFSDLFDRVGISDSGQFNYHLDKLRSLYVEQIDDRYRLTPIGLRLVQSVIAGAGQSVDYQPTQVDADCRICGSPIRIAYDGIRVYFVCSSCDGVFDHEDYPDGTLWGMSLPAAGVANRSPEEIFSVVSFLHWPKKAYLTGKVCPVCSGVLKQSIDICEEHDSEGEGPCEECGYTDPIKVNWLCSVCKYHGMGTPSGYLHNHPAVIAFRYEHDIHWGYPYTTSAFEATQREESVRREIEFGLELVRREPIEMRATIRYDGDAIALTLDEELSVTGVDWPPDN